MKRATFGVVIAAAGTGRRFGEAKQFLALLGRPILHFSLDVFASLERVAEIVIVGPPEGLERTREVEASWRSERRGDAPRIAVVAGGAERQDSVRAGLARLSPSVEHVLVHDAARPLVRRDEVEKVAAAIFEHGAAAIGHPATDSLHAVLAPDDPRVERRLERARVWQVQTPQGSRRDLLERAYERPDSGRHTDEVSLLVATGVDVRLVAGSAENIKVTHPGDLELAEFLLRRRLAGERAER